jgi:hypothetical protein
MHPIRRASLYVIFCELDNQRKTLLHPMRGRMAKRKSRLGRIFKLISVLLAVTCVSVAIDYRAFPYGAAIGGPSLNTGNKSACADSVLMNHPSPRLVGRSLKQIVQVAPVVKPWEPNPSILSCRIGESHSQKDNGRFSKNYQPTYHFE